MIFGPLILTSDRTNVSLQFAGNVHFSSNVAGNFFCYFKKKQYAKDKVFLCLILLPGPELILLSSLNEISHFLIILLLVSENFSKTNEDYFNLRFSYLII